MYNIRDSLHRYIDVMTNEEINKLCEAWLAILPADKPLPDEIQAILDTEQDELVDYDDIQWN